MTAVDRNPSNPNMLQPNKFQLNFARAPSLQFFTQSVNFPGLSMNDVPRATPFVDLYEPGEKVNYDTLNITFLVDELLTSWFEVHDWIRALTFPTDFREYQKLGQLSPDTNQNFPQFSDCSITILNSAQKPTFRIKFVDCFPIALSTLIFSTTDDPNNILTADATFRFAYFDIAKLN